MLQFKFVVHGFLAKNAWSELLVNGNSYTELLLYCVNFGVSLSCCLYRSLSHYWSYQWYLLLTMLHVFCCFLADTMMKFASFETIVEMIYKYSIPVPKDQCSKSLQLGVSFAGGYVAGVFCAVVSHPADNLVSFLNNAKGATVGDVCTFSQ
jgi:hypothetical protein